jgi:hypothetical protein
MEKSLIKKKGGFFLRGEGEKEKRKAVKNLTIS